MTNLLRYLYRQSNVLLIFAFVCALLSGLGGAALIQVINEGVKGKATAALGLSFFALCLATLVTRSLSQIAILHLSQNAVLTMRIDLSKKLLATPYKKLQELGKPSLLVILTRDIETFIGALQILPRVLTDATVIITCLAFVAWMSWTLFGLLLVTLLVGMTAFLAAQRYPMSQLKIIRAKMDHLYKHFRDLVEGSRELQLNKQRGQMFVDTVIASEAREYRSIFIRGFSSFTWISNIGDMLFYLTVGVLLFVVPLWLPQPIEVMASVTLVLLYLIGPIGSMINAMPALGQAAVALGKIQQLDAKLVAELPNMLGNNPFQTEQEVQLELRGVCHHYPGVSDDTPFLLGPLDISVRKGEILFIVGGNGSGKTTLAMLLLGLYTPESGSLCMNGETVTDANLDFYRSHFAVVFADFHLFEHLLGSDQQVSDEAAAGYLQKLGMKHHVKVVDGKFSTINLSSGQKKRLALVVAYLEDKPIYLFDEWAADQDPVFKRVFYTELLPELKARGKTVIVISHDDAYFDCADRLIKLQDGHVGGHLQARGEPAMVN